VDDEIAEADRSRTAAFVSSRCVSVNPGLCFAKQQVAIKDLKQKERLTMSIVSFSKVS
jgi:hypothetical protein